MNRRAVWLLHLTAWSSAVSGAVYGVMRYWPLPEDSLEIMAHPWQPHFQYGHILASAGLALLLGYVAGCHAVPHVAAGTKSRRRSGWTLLGSAAPMVFSGFALQMAVSPWARVAWSAAHISTSVVWLAGLILHLFARRRRLP